ncbi:hypothetical protein M8J75_002271 [Diaphorina citri]|nr:hypothetical protein M8J75_002271 [Diaphorina citri]
MMQLLCCDCFSRDNVWTSLVLLILLTAIMIYCVERFLLTSPPEEAEEASDQEVSTSETSKTSNRDNPSEEIEPENDRKKNKKRKT